MTWLTHHAINLARCLTEGGHPAGHPGVAPEIKKPLATAQDPENHHQQQVPDRDADPTSRPRFRDDSQKADQIKIGCGS